jgi:hypothetical protein
MTTSRAAVWIVGNWRHADFAAAVAWLNEVSHCIVFDSAATAAESLGSSWLEREPEAILLVQSRPGQLGDRDIEQLHAAAPLARLVALVGPWCEGEMRSGRAWPGVVRVPWRGWQSRLPQVLGLDRSDEERAERLPRTATETERIERSIVTVAANRRFRRMALVRTNSRLTFESIADALAQLGMKAVWRCGADRSALAAIVEICDGWEQLPAAETALPCVLVLHFPRPDDVLRAQSLGIAAVVAQPLLMADLAAALGAAAVRNDLMPPPSETAHPD